MVEPSTARHEAHRGDSGFAEANAGLQPAAVLKPDRANAERKAKKAMDKLITRKEAASILGISVKTLDAARTDGLISYVQYVENGCVYFTEVGIQEYIAKCTHRAKPMERAATYRKPRSFRR